MGPHIGLISYTIKCREQLEIVLDKTVQDHDFYVGFTDEDNHLIWTTTMYYSFPEDDIDFSWRFPKGWDAVNVLFFAPSIIKVFVMLRDNSLT